MDVIINGLGEVHTRLIGFFQQFNTLGYVILVFPL
jgi:hypothetical protein